MKVKSADGHEFEIHVDEAKRIVEMMRDESSFEEMKDRNARYLHKALHNIKRLMSLDDLPESEDALKGVIYCIIPGTTCADANALYEIIEAAIAKHFKELAE